MKKKIIFLLLFVLTIITMLYGCTQKENYGKISFEEKLKIKSNGAGNAADSMNWNYNIKTFDDFEQNVIYAKEGRYSTLKYAIARVECTDIKHVIRVDMDINFSRTRSPVKLKIKEIINSYGNDEVFYVGQEILSAFSYGYLPENLDDYCKKEFGMTKEELYKTHGDHLIDLTKDYNFVMDGPYFGETVPMAENEEYLMVLTYDSSYEGDPDDIWRAEYDYGYLLIVPYNMELYEDVFAGKCGFYYSNYHLNLINEFYNEFIASTAS